MSDSKVNEPEIRVVEKLVRGVNVRVEVAFFPEKYTTVSASFRPSTLDNYCEVHITLVDGNNRRFKTFPKVQFHSSGKVIGYGYAPDGVKFRTIKPDRDRHRGALISIS